MRHSFGSDNHSGVAPEIMEAIFRANNGFAKAYGEDALTARAETLFKEMFGPDTGVFFVLNGTGANVLALKALTQTFNSVICPDTAHINVDECGAPENMAGCKLVPIPSINGKVTIDAVKNELRGFGFQHHAQPKVLSISQPTEQGTLYTLSEIAELAKLMHEHDCYLHIDGSRISNAAAAMKMAIPDFTSNIGVDALSFGGTKNGLMIGEALLFFRKELSKNFPYIRKQSAQLYSKNRFIAAQFEAYLKDGLNIKLAEQANQMASYLATQLSGTPGITITKPVETNTVFAIVPPYLTERLLEKYFFHIWNEDIGEVRWVCSFNTTKEDIDGFVNDIKSFK